jgi:NAD(P)-dependent dehydrogenase (short-subunit alcohol dehydrogenase family)
MVGQRALITGANSGLGLEAALVLARQGASVALACRSSSKCTAAAAAVRRVARPGAAVTTWVLNTSSLASVRAFAARFLAEGGSLDMLLLNAGIASAGAWAPGEATLPLSEDGIEAVLATNHVGGALLYELLLPLLKAARTSRVVLTSSASSFDTYSYGVALDLETLNAPPERGVTSTLNPYGQSKLAQIIWAQEAARRLEEEGVDNIFVNAMHPGSVDTGIWGANPILPSFLKRTLFAYLQREVMWTVKDGALTLLYLAMAEADLRKKNVKGQYWHPQCVRVEPHPAAANLTLQLAFWDFTHQLTRL